MTDLSNYSDEELMKAAGVAPASPQTAPTPNAADPLAHLSDQELEKIASGGDHPFLPPPPPQDTSWWREPKLIGSRLAKGALETWENAMDTSGTATMQQATAMQNVMSELGLSDQPQKPLTEAVIHNAPKALAMAKEAGIIDRSDVIPQNIPEKLLGAGSEGVGSALSMGTVDPRALLAAGTSSIGSKTAQNLFPNSSVAPIIGAVAGGLAPAGIEAAASGLTNLTKNAFGLYDPSVRADEIMARKLTADNLDPSEMSKTLQQFPDKPLTIADVGGDATKRLARASLDIPSEGSAGATKFLQDRDLGAGINGEFDMMRQGGAADRVVGDIKKALGSDDAFKTIDDLVAQGDANSAPLYDAFRAEPPTPARQVQQFMTSPTFRASVGRANAALLDEGKSGLSDYIDFNEAGDPLSVKGQAFSPDALQRIKEGIDDNWIAAKGTGDRGAIRTANNLRTRYLDFLDSKYPDTYPQARAAFAGPAAARDAIQQGMEVFQNSPEDVAKTIQSLPPENQDMFRLGVQKAMIGKVLNTADGANEVKAIFGKPALRNSIAAAFDDPQALNNLSQALGAENRMFRVNNVAGNSRTTPSLLDQADLQGGAENTKPLIAAGAHLMGGNPVGAALHLIDPTFKKFLGNIGEGTRSQTASLLAERVFNPDLAQNQARLELVQALMGNQQPQSLVPPTMPLLPYVSGLSASGSRQ